MDNRTVIDGSRALRITTADVSRFWSKVDRTGPGACWLWTASVRPDGYGQFGVHNGSATWTSVKAYRLAWALSGRELTPGMDIDHICHVRHCVNPDHLRIVTRGQNVANRKGAQRNSASGVRGVFRDCRRDYVSWVARATCAGRTVSSYGHPTIESAEIAALRLRVRLGTANQGDLARLAELAG